MSIALLIRGFFTINVGLCKDYNFNKISYKNNILKIIESIKTQNNTNNIDIYFHTYDYEINLNELIKLFNPIDFILNSIKTPISHNDYIKKNVYSLFSVLNIFLKNMYYTNKTYDKIFILNNDTSELQNTIWSTSINNLPISGFIYGIHNDYINIFKQLCMKSDCLYIDFKNINEHKNILCNMITNANPHYYASVDLLQINGIYIIYNLSSKKYIYVNNPQPTNYDSIELSNNFTPFYIFSRGNKYHIKLLNNIKNQNGTDGWYLYTVNTNYNKVFGAGNDGAWATFDFEDSDTNTNDFFIKSYHKNPNGSYRYIACFNNELSSNGTVNHAESLWNLKPHNDISHNYDNYLICGKVKIFNNKSMKYLNVINPTQSCSLITLSVDPYIFYMYYVEPYYFIRLPIKILNQNSTYGWHLYVYKDDALYGAGNCSIYSSFIIEKKDKNNSNNDGFIIKTAFNNNNNSNNCVYVDATGNNIRITGNSDMPEAIWKITK